MVIDLLRVLSKCFFLQANPQDFPCNWRVTLFFATLMSIGGGINIYILSDILPAGEEFNLILPVVFDVLYLALFVRILLILLKKQERFNQTASALYGISFVVALLQTPMYWYMGDILDLSGFTGMDMPIALSIYSIVVLIYFVRLLVHIFKQAVEVSGLSALGLAILYIFGNVILGFVVSAVSIVSGMH